jgi:hypothetical protein
MEKKQRRNFGKVGCTEFTEVGFRTGRWRERPILTREYGRDGHAFGIRMVR